MKNWLAKNALFIAVILVTLISAFYAGTIFSKWDVINDKFYDIKINDVIGLLTTIIIGCYVSFIVTEKTGNSAKRKEIVFTMIDNLGKSIEKTHEAIKGHIKSPTNETARNVRVYFNEAELEITDLLTLESDGLLSEINIDQGLKLCFLEYKNASTENFGSTSPYTQEQMNRIDTSKHSLSRKIHETKYKLYK